MSTTTTTPTTTMRAVVHRTYGAPEKLVSVTYLCRRSARTRAGQGPRSRGRPRRPGLALRQAGSRRPASGFFRPRRPVLGRALAGRVEAVGSTVTDLGTGRRGLGRGHARRESTPRSPPRVWPGSRRVCAFSRRPPYRSPPPPPCRRWTRARWAPAQTAGRRRVRRWQLRGPARQGPRRRGHRSLRPRQRRSGAITGAPTTSSTTPATTSLAPARRTT